MSAMSQPTRPTQPSIPLVDKCSNPCNYMDYGGGDH